ncbi:hypothetical protein PLESTB_000443300 [Pleodorina starrii]|uniref:Uncharacterized protein n=1 Tax=Pleodorina starrii TaxID=330485 RepID=A0A9W6BF18_9CHLO|nr:hypothetical protein PLESTM_000677500 [Pleodorina starrii]GLC50889.1 hypothetical protein PLESTB_000443300 [Pleodorina starrii]
MVMERSRDVEGSGAESCVHCGNCGWWRMGQGGWVRAETGWNAKGKLDSRTVAWVIGAIRVTGVVGGGEPPAEWGLRNEEGGAAALQLQPQFLSACASRLMIGTVELCALMAGGRARATCVALGCWRCDDTTRHGVAWGGVDSCVRA